jgi:two-component system cell cycle sensor histidine kinase/response regulator CckA
MNTYKVLIAEDEGSVAVDLAARLEELGHTVVAVVSTAKDAIEQAPNAQVVLMDVSLEGPVDGIEAASKIRERYRLPVLFLTAQTDPPTLERAKLAAPFGYIVKPVPHASLHPSIEIAMHMHQMELRLEESEYWLRATLESLPAAVIVVDAEGQIRVVNPAAELLGAGAPSFLAELLPEDSAALAVLQDGPVPISVRGPEQCVEGFTAPLKISGAVIGAVITLHDATSRLREERRLNQLEKLASSKRLAACLADNLASPIYVIRNRSKQLVHQFGDHVPMREAFMDIEQAAVELDKLTQRLEKLGAFPNRRFQVLSLNGILRRMSKFIQYVVGDHVSVTFEPGAGIGRIYADSAETIKLITELIFHAVRALPRGGHIRIATLADGDYASLSVTPNGSLADLECSDDPTLMCYLVPGENRLEAFLPLWTDPVPGEGASPTLLLIEPRENIRARLRAFFEANGFNLLEATDDEEANSLVELHNVALVLGGTAERGAIPVLRLTVPYTEQQMLERVRILLAPSLCPLEGST